jgi:hypothetical protein
VAGLSQSAPAQQPQWAPSRLPDNSAARPLNQALPSNKSAQGLEQSPFLAEVRPNAAPHNGHPLTVGTPPAEQLGSGVALRWKTVVDTAASQQAAERATQVRQQASQQLAESDHTSRHDAIRPQTSELTARNPLRSQVIQVAYQQQLDANGNTPPPTLLPNGSALPALPNASPGLPPATSQPMGLSPLGHPDFSTPRAPAANALPPIDSDPLDTPELPPPPTQTKGTGDGTASVLENQTPNSPFPPPRQSEVSPADRSPADPNDVGELPPPRSQDDRINPGSNELQRRNENSNLGSCDELRARFRANPITAVSLDVSPGFGAGIRAQKGAEQQRLDFAASAPVREWTDYRGYSVAYGRMIDLRDGRVIIDANGQEQSMLLRDLSDVDTAYVGEAWNIPDRCGTGFDPFDGRNFVPSTVQWAASGLCHKPLYFEQVQLERYGHEIGPVLQPLVSTAHFFGTIPLLPYKMGIHPPFECQYELGYYRPGSCAPYMIPPIPWSLRGAAAQAAAVTGGAALIP